MTDAPPATMTAIEIAEPGGPEVLRPTWTVELPERMVTGIMMVWN